LDCPDLIAQFEEQRKKKEAAASGKRHEEKEQKKRKSTSTPTPTQAKKKSVEDKKLEGKMKKYSEFLLKADFLFFFSFFFLFSVKGTKILIFIVYSRMHFLVL